MAQPIMHVPPVVPGRRPAASIWLSLLLASAALGTRAGGLADSGADAVASAEGRDTLPAVSAIAATPLPGFDIPLRDVPANVQTIGPGNQQGPQHTGMGDYLEQNFTGINLNAAQGNPYQPDISFRGFTASPLLGLPQGLSVFQDGVRINEPFGDAVNWDLLPSSAIASMLLMPGSNPLYGLNTLGGALALATKDGISHPGSSVQVSGGSFGRRASEFETGGQSGTLDYFLTGNLADDPGWAEHHPSRLRQGFGKLGYRAGGTRADLALTLANNRLEGTQTLPQSFAENPRQAYTYPDLNTNKLLFLTNNFSHAINADSVLGGHLYYRHYRSTNVSSNINDHYGRVQPNDADGDIDQVEAFNNRSALAQVGYGAALQLSLAGAVLGRRNQFVVGASLDAGRARFTQDEQAATLTDTRGTIGIGDFSRETAAHTRNHIVGLFLTDTLNLDERWTLSLAGRYERAYLRIRDDSGEAPALNGDHAFSHFNPALGLNWNPSPRLSTYVSYNQGMRAPTAIELTCADPQAPCKLPNSFLADPPLKKVVATTLEIGARGKTDQDITWSAALYRTDLADDIQFISSGGAASNAGYFQNVGKTRRQGLELAAARSWSKLVLSARYAFLDARYRSSFTENSPVNSSAADDGTIAVAPGNRIPGLPRHSLRLRIDLSAAPAWDCGASMTSSGGIFARGDENNLDARGKVPGYSVVNLDTRLRLGTGWELIGRIDNLFDRRYANFGVLGLNAFSGSNHVFDGANAIGEQFRGYGAPRALWLGARYAWR
ncbi:MAG: TonB-dependent receptor [Janthinobacterium lividum]